MIIQKIPISQINPAPYNPRLDLKPEDPEYQKLEQSITNFGYVEPIVWNRQTGNLVGGHQRLKILIAQGLTEVEVSVVDLPTEKEKALNLALNKIQGRWDEQKLAIILDELVKLPDFDEGLSGFDGDEISRIIDNHFAVGEESFDLEKALAAIDVPVTKPGDVINLGLHRIICADTAQGASLRNLLGEERIALLHMDVPYGISYDAKNRPNADRENATHHWKLIQNDELKGADHVQWFTQVITSIKPFLEPNASVYFWDGFVNFGPITQVLVENGFHVSNVITWIKPTACPSFGDYWFQSEFLLYGWLKSNVSHRWFGSKGESNVWQVDREPSNELQHPTMKSTELARRAIKNSSIRGDIVFDGCMGAGFNLLACQQLNRVFRGVEIEPIYVDVSVRRYIRMFGKNSVSAEILQKYWKEEDTNG